jgi:Tol biopolymer transport system component
MSADGRFVAFESLAGNLVPGGVLGMGQAYVRDRKTGRTELVSVGPRGVHGDGESSEPAISGDGRFVAFLSYATNLVAGDTTGCPDVFVRDRQLGTTTRVSVGPRGIQANDASGVNVLGSVAISADGRRGVRLERHQSGQGPGPTREISRPNPAGLTGWRPGLS